MGKIVRISLLEIIKVHMSDLRMDNHSMIGFKEGISHLKRIRFEVGSKNTAGPENFHLMCGDPVAE